MIMYELIKALHIISIISWMVGLLYLPRLYVYHSESLPGSITYQTFLIMEKRLIKIIMLPSMIISLLLGVYLLFVNIDLWEEPYFQIKILLVIGLFIFHGFLIKVFKKFDNESNERTATFYRKINEIPTLLMIIIIILVVVKPNLM
tara:strand:+ start:132 stop:569 length:438 start_codon:yes stop_codon:yes gene_type:complete